jgi:hypothetical protein
VTTPGPELVLVEVVAKLADGVADVEVISCSAATSIGYEETDGLAELNERYVSFIKVSLISATGFAAVAQQMLIWSKSCQSTFSKGRENQKRSHVPVT